MNSPPFRPDNNGASETAQHAAAWGGRIVVAAVMTVALAGFLAWMLWLAWPREAAVDATAQAGVPCASYAPFRRSGHTPFDPLLRVTPEQVREDLRRLSTLTHCVRTYGVDQGAEAVPAIARELGMQVVLGAWISRDAARNEMELSRALRLANEYRDVVRLLVVGNEVLLRGEQTPQAMAALLARARAASAVPVTYADVWEFWLRHADALRAQVDTVTVHILPYWEDEPVGVDRAVDHVLAVATKVRERFGAQPLFIGETGWPAEGRQRGPARPGVIEQTRFVRELLAVQGRLPPLNLIEAYDQPWKRKLEGAVGGQWGLFDAAGQQRVQLAGPMARPGWKDATLWAAALGAVACAVLAALRYAARHAVLRPARLSGRAAQAATVVLAAAGGAAVFGAAAWQLHLLQSVSRTPLEWTVNTLVAAAGVFGVFCAFRASSVGAAGRPLQDTWQRTSFAVTLLMAVFTLLLWQLAWDGRYRVLLWPLPMAAALALACVVAWRAAGAAALASDEHRPLHAPQRMGRWLRTALAIVGSACAAAVLWQEGPHNAQALWLAAAWAALLAAAGLSAWHGAHPPEAASAPLPH